jgi:hypothetical protein
MHTLHWVSLPIHEVENSLPALGETAVQKEVAKHSKLTLKIRKPSQVSKCSCNHRNFHPIEEQTLGEKEEVTLLSKQVNGLRGIFSMQQRVI